MQQNKKTRIEKNISVYTTEEGEKRWFVRVRKKGLPDFTATCLSLKEARAKRAIGKGLALSGKLEKKQRTMTVGDYADKYLAKIKHRESPYPGYESRSGRDHPTPCAGCQAASQVEWWRSKIGKLDVTELTPGHINDVLDAAGRTGSNRNHYLTRLSMTLRLAIADRVLSTNPARDAERGEDGKRPVRYSTAQRAALLEAVTVESQVEANGDRLPHTKDWEPPRHDLYVMTWLALHCGFRKNELPALRWSDVKWDGNANRSYPHVHLAADRRKNRTALFMPLTVAAIDLLRDWQELCPGDGSGKLFPGMLTFPTKGWTRAARGRAGITEMHGEGDRVYSATSPHDMRRDFASCLADCGASTDEIMLLLGDRDPDMGRRYAERENRFAPLPEFQELLDMFRNPTGIETVQAEVMDLEAALAVVRGAGLNVTFLAEPKPPEPKPPEPEPHLRLVKDDES